jgi:hypothetical protein
MREGLNRVVFRIDRRSLTERHPGGATSNEIRFCCAGNIPVDDATHSDMQQRLFRIKGPFMEAKLANRPATCRSNFIFGIKRSNEVAVHAAVCEPQFGPQ